jgi:hypothetical protein
MTAIPGSVRVTGFLAPSDSADTYAVTDDTYHRGGFRPVADAAARDAITEGRRKVGMLVYCIAEDKYYQCTVATTPPTWAEAAFGGGDTREGVCELVTANRMVLPADNRLFLESDAAGSSVTPIGMTIDQAPFVLLDDEGWQVTFKVGMNDDGDPVPVFAACSTSEMSIDDATFIQTLYSAQLGDYLTVRYAYAGARRGRFLVVGGKGTWTDDLGGVHVFGSSGAINVATTMYVDGTAGDDGNDGLAWLTAKKTFGFLIAGATDAISHEINAVLTINFRNDIRARDANGHLVLKGFYGTGRIDFVGTLTAVETFTATTYENDPAVRSSRVWIQDGTKSWTPGQWRRHFVGLAPGSASYPVYDNDATTLNLALHASLVGAPAGTIYKAPELLEELESDPGVKYDFGTFPSIYFGIRNCGVPVAISNLWVDEAMSSNDGPVFRDCYEVNLYRVAFTTMSTSYITSINHFGCYYNLSNNSYVLDGYSYSSFSNCALHSLDDTGWGYNSYDHSSAYFYHCIFSRQLFGVYLSHFGAVLFQEGVYFEDCDLGVGTAGGVVELVHPSGVTPQVRFDTCDKAIQGTGLLLRLDSTEVAVWDVGTEIVFGTDDEGTFAELSAKTLKGRAGLNVIYSNVDFDLNVPNEYDNTTSELYAVNYQDAIDEVAAAGGKGTYLATFTETNIDLVDDTDFTAIEPSSFWTEGMGYTLEITPTSATGNLTVILYQDAARLVPVYMLISDLSDADTWRSSEAFGFELETAGTLYGTAFVSGAEPGKVFSISLSTVVVQPVDPPEPLTGPYGDGIEDDGGGLPRIAFPSDGGFAFVSHKLELKPDITADVYPTLTAAGVAITGAVTTTTDEDVPAKKRFTAVGMDYLAANGPPVAGTYLAGHEVLDLSGVKWRCISDGTPGTWVLVDFVADDVADYETALLTPGDSEVVEILTTGDVGYFQHIQIWGVVATAAEYSSEFRARIYQTSNILGREMVWQGVGTVRQSYLTVLLPAATASATVDNEDVFDTDEACVVFEDNTRYELARINSRSTATVSFDEVLVDPSSWAINTLVCSSAQFDMVPFRNTDGTPANRGRAFLHIRNDSAGNEVVFFIRVMPMSTGIIGGGLA